MIQSGADYRRSVGNVTSESMNGSHRWMNGRCDWMNGFRPGRLS
jgi:hypothetical protein